jgi:hypothetical protein
MSSLGPVAFELNSAGVRTQRHEENYFEWRSRIAFSSFSFMASIDF